MYDSMSYCWPCLTLPVGETTNLWLVDSIKLPRHKYENKCDVKCDKTQDNLRGQTCFTVQRVWRKAAFYITVASQIRVQRIPIKPPKAHITIFGRSNTNEKMKFLKNLRWSSLHKNEMIRDMFENKDLPRFSHIDESLLFCDFWGFPGMQSVLQTEEGHFH